MTRKSTEGYIFKLFGGPIDWKSRRQGTMTASTTEAELLSLSHAGKELIGWKRLFKQIDFDPEDAYPNQILCDNRQTVNLMTKESPVVKKNFKHVDVNQHLLRQEYQKGTLDIQWIGSKSMASDGSTKPLPRQRFAQFLEKLGMADLRPHLGR